jgi:hypothetical protein
MYTTWGRWTPRFPVLVPDFTAAAFEPPVDALYVSG